MSIIPELSPTVISELESNTKAAQGYLSQCYYSHLKEQNRDHLLVRIGARFDFAALEEACSSYHCYEEGGRGQAADHTVSYLCRALVVQRLYGWSNRKIAEEIQSNTLVRCFVGYGLFDETMSYGTIFNFGKWVREKGLAQEFFTQFLSQIDEDYPEERSQPQIGDTFALLSRAAPQSKTVLVRSASQRVLDYLSVAKPVPERALLDAVDRRALFGPEDEKPEYLLEKKERDERAEKSALAAIALLAVAQTILAQLPPSRTVERLALEEWVQRLSKILHDEFLFEADDSETIIKATLREKHESGAFAIGSTIDPDATFRNHGKKSDLGYNVNVAATERFVREINAVTGATSDGSGVPDLISNQLEHQGFAPPKLIYDRAAGHPKYFAEVHRVSNGQTQLVARLIEGGRNSNRFGPRDFTLNKVGHLVCPNGQVSTKPFRTERKDANGWTYPFYPKQCQGCPLVDKCRGDKVKPTSRRTVFISGYAYYQREAIAYAKTDAFKQDMKSRSGVERVIAGLARYNDARHANSFGLDNADYQVKMAGMAYNLKRWVALQREAEAQEKRLHRERHRERQHQRQQQQLLPQQPDNQHSQQNHDLQHHPAIPPPDA